MKGFCFYGVFRIPLSGAKISLYEGIKNKVFAHDRADQLQPKLSKSSISLQHKKILNVTNLRAIFCKHLQIMIPVKRNLKNDKAGLEHLLSSKELHLLKK